MGSSQRNMDIFLETRRLSKESDKLSVSLAKRCTKVFQFNKLDCLDWRKDVVFLNTTTVDAALKYRDEAYSITILNFADAVKAGGEVDIGEETQEEHLCRCTTLYETLIQDSVFNEYYKPNRERGDLIFNDALIRSPFVDIIRDGEYNLLEEPLSVCVLSCPCIADKNGFEQNIDTIRWRIHNILMCTLDDEENTIILGAWGCGDFGQKAENIGRLFAEELTEMYKFDQRFERIVFAVTDAQKLEELKRGVYEGIAQYEKMVSLQKMREETRSI